jgi:hypothetical protein
MFNDFTKIERIGILVSGAALMAAIVAQLYFVIISI